MNIEQFVTLLANSRLMSRDKAQELATAFQEGCRRLGKEETVNAFCAFLTSTNLLTQWQCNKLLMGKWKGFYLGKYLLLDHVGKDNYNTFYKGRDTQSGQLVRVVVTPSKDGSIQYSVSRYTK